MPVRIEKELKHDTFGCVELVRVDGASGRPAARLVRRVVVARFGLGWAAGLLARREARALRRLRECGARGVAAAPDLDEALLQEARSLETARGERPDPRRVHLRPYAEGEPLHRAESLPLDFFDLLERRVAELHAAGVCHNDLHKEQNVVVGLDGAPVLIDFQLATLHPRRSGRWFEARCRDDLRHVQKHRRRYTRDGRGPAALRVEESARMRRRGIALAWMRTVKPLYRFVTRRILRTRDGEEARSSSGPWPRWTAPVGERSVEAAQESPQQPASGVQAED